MAIEIDFWSLESPLYTVCDCVSGGWGEN